MAFSALNGVLGCAIYDPIVCKMNLVEDVRLPISTNKVAERMVLNSDTDASEQPSLTENGSYEETEASSHSLDSVSMRR